MWLNTQQVRCLGLAGSSNNDNEDGGGGDNDDDDDDDEDGKGVKCSEKEC